MPGNADQNNSKMIFTDNVKAKDFLKASEIDFFFQSCIRFTNKCSICCLMLFEKLGSFWCLLSILLFFGIEKKLICNFFKKNGNSCLLRPLYNNKSINTTISKQVFLFATYKLLNVPIRKENDNNLIVSYQDNIITFQIFTKNIAYCLQYFSQAY